MDEEQLIVTGLQTRAANFEASTINEEDYTVEVVFTTGAQGRRSSWRDGEYMEELEVSESAVMLGRMNDGSAPLLDNHEAYGGIRSMLGIVLRGYIKGGKGMAVIQFDKGERGADAFRRVKEGTLRKISVGYVVHEYKKKERKDSIPLYTAVSWEPYELSLVPMPFDQGAQVRSAGGTDPGTTGSPAGSNSAGGANINFQTIIRRNMDENEIIEGTTPQGSGGAGGNVTPPGSDGAGNGNPARGTNTQQRSTVPGQQSGTPSDASALVAERARVNQIRQAVETAGLPADFALDLIGRNVNIADARMEIITRMAAGGAPAINSGTDGAPVDASTRGDAAVTNMRDGMTAALILRSGEVPRERLTERERTLASEYRYATLYDLARTSLERRGVNVMKLSKLDLVNRAMSSTSDFPIILEGTARRTLEQAYLAVPDVWRMFCAVGSVEDFREYKRVRTGSISRLTRVPESGEFKRVQIPDGEQAVVSVDTYGNIIDVTREMIINDDLGAFTRIPGQFGRAAARSIEIDVFGVIAANPTLSTDNVALFHSTHNNLAASGTAITVAAMDAARVAMGRQKDPSGNDFIGIRPSILLTSLEKGGEARVVNDAQFDVDVSNKFQVPNKVRGMVGKIIDTEQLTGNAWFLFADPSLYPVLEVNFLQGVETPVLEQDQEFNTNGLKWRIRFDYGVDAVDYRGVYKNPGN